MGIAAVTIALRFLRIYFEPILIIRIAHIMSSPQNKTYKPNILDMHRQESKAYFPFIRVLSTRVSHVDIKSKCPKGLQLSKPTLVYKKESTNSYTLSPQLEFTCNTKITKQPKESSTPKTFQAMSLKVECHRNLKMMSHIG